LGDLLSQDTWNYNDEDLVGNNHYVYDTLVKAFWGGKQDLSELDEDDVLILPVNGNHETPFIDYENYDDQNDIVKTGILSAFKRFIGEENVSDMQTKGFYQIEDAVRNIIYIGVDSNFNSIFNSYASQDSTNPMNFIYNLGDALYHAEQNNKKVIFLSHISFSDETGMTTLSKFIKLLFQRFANIIEISLAAHTHNDTISFYTDTNKQPMFLELTSPGLTTYTNLFPSFRIYEMNAQGNIFDYVQWRMNIDVLNVYASQEDFRFYFDVKYRFSEEYKVDLAAEDRKKELLLLYERLTREASFLKKYTMNYLTLYKLDLDNGVLENKMQEVKCLMLDQPDLIERCAYVNGGNYLDYFGIVAYRWVFERSLWFYLDKNKKGSLI
jgi:hypothetical protein